MQIVMDYFIDDHVIEVIDSDVDYVDQDKMNKRRTRETRYEGDPNFALPLMYVAICTSVWLMKLILGLLR